MDNYRPTTTEKVTIMEANMVNFMNNLTKGDKRMDKIEKSIESTNKIIGTIQDDVLIIKNALIGNGQEGMIKRVSRHEKTFNIHHGALAIIGSLGMITGAFYTIMQIIGGS